MKSDATSNLRPSSHALHEAVDSQPRVLLLGRQILQSIEQALLTDGSSGGRLDSFPLCSGSSVLLSRRDLEEVEDLVGSHRFETCVLLVDDRVGDVEFEALETTLKRRGKGERLASRREEGEREIASKYSPHDLLLERPLRDEPVDVDDLLLSESMSSIHSLQILHRVPIVLDEDDRIRSCEVESESSDLRREKENVDAGIRVEGLDDSVSFGRIRRTVHPHVGDRRHVGSEEVVLDDVKHRLELAEDEDSMLRDGGEGEVVDFCWGGGFRASDSTVEEDLPSNGGDEEMERRSALDRGRVKSGERSEREKRERAETRRKIDQTHLRAINLGAFSRSRIELGPADPPAFLTFATIDLYSESFATRQGWLQSFRRY